ncbi:unnamed protein product [Musa hybrid cultivar]
MCVYIYIHQNEFGLSRYSSFPTCPFLDAFHFLKEGGERRAPNKPSCALYRKRRCLRLILAIRGSHDLYVRCVCWYLCSFCVLLSVLMDAMITRWCGTDDYKVIH